jgi:hypothetical protein
VYRQIGKKPLGGLSRKARQVAKTKVKGFDGECWRSCGKLTCCGKFKAGANNWREELFGMFRGKSKAREENSTGVP